VKGSFHGMTGVGLETCGKQFLRHYSGYVPWEETCGKFGKFPPILNAKLGYWERHLFYGGRHNWSLFGNIKYYTLICIFVYYGRVNNQKEVCSSL